MFVDSAWTIYLDSTWTKAKGLESHYCFPIKHHANTQPRLSFSGPTVHCWGCLYARRQHWQEAGLSWDPRTSRSEDWLNFALKFPAALIPQHNVVPPDTAHTKPLNIVQWRAPCQTVLTSPQFSSGTQACSASRDGIASQVREVGHHTLGTAFLPFSLTSCQDYPQHIQSTCCDGCHFTVAWFRYEVICGFSLWFWGYYLP